MRSEAMTAEAMTAGAMKAEAARCNADRTLHPNDQSEPTQNADHRGKPVSYTHLTLPTTPYV